MPRKQARYGQPAVYNATAPTLSDGDDSALNVNASAELLTASKLVPVSTLGHGSRTVAAAGTDVQLSATSVPCRWVTIEAYRSNTGIIAIGGSGVDAAAAGSGGTIAAGEPARVDISDLTNVYIDATVSGEGVRYTYGV